MKRWKIGSITFFISLALGVAATGLLQQTRPNLSDLELVVNKPDLTTPIDLTDSLPIPTEHDDSSNKIDESFTDDSRIGRSRKNKVEVHCFERGDGMIAEIKFFSRSKSGKWEQKQSFEFEKDNLTPCNPKVRDFNGDGFKDLTYVSDVAARGANEVRKLFRYDKKRNELVYVLNSEDYPNFAYNRKLKCLDAMLFHGATTTVFLKLEGDMLREFASVDTGLQLVVTVTDTSGKERVIRRQKMNEDDIYTRYSNFNPLEP